MHDSTAERGELLDRLPHRAPFRFLTTLDERDDESARGTWHVDGTEAFFAGHFPGRPLVPGVLLAEALAQLSGLVACAGDENEHDPARLAHVDVRLVDAVTPPATIALQTRVVRALGTLVLFDVQAKVGERIVARGQLSLGRAPAAGGAS